jgi:hypothetical protein
MAVQGSWTLHYSWGFTGNYAQAPITFNSDGTFGGAYTGKWRQLAGTLMLSFNGGPAKYAGTLDGNVANGEMSTYVGNDGAWYLTRKGMVGVLAGPAVAASMQPMDAAGMAP